MPFGKKPRRNFLPLAILCIVSGILLQLESMGVVSGVSRFWPMLVTLLGIGQILLFYQRSSRDILLLGIGVYLICVSGLFFYCNVAGWSMMAVCWPLFVGFVGVACAACIPYVASKVLVIGIALFLVSAAAVFFLVFSVDTGLWPMSLILFGICILVWRLA